MYFIPGLGGFVTPKRLRLFFFFFFFIQVECVLAGVQ